jgi:hypothetical protein
MSMIDAPGKHNKGFFRNRYSAGSAETPEITEF